MALRNKFIDADQGYLLSFLGGLFMQHMAHFHCHYYTAKYPVCVEFIDFSALLYDKIRGLNLGLCLQSEGTTFSVVPIISYVSSFVVTTGHDYFISIHAPAQGATWMEKDPAVLWTFQSTPPRRGRQASTQAASTAALISIHAPAQGATSLYVQQIRSSA